MSAQDDGPVLSVRGLTISFDSDPRQDRRPAVRGVDFEIRRGQILAIVGESGSGKSVTALTVLGLLPPSARVAGSIRLRDEEIVGASQEDLRRVRAQRVGIVFQEPMSAFNPVLRVGTQLAEAIWAGGKRRARGTVRDRSLSLLEDVGLREPERILQSFPHQLSGGQLQRAMIAMATARDPELLIADEPTTALDVTVQAGVLELIRSLSEEREMAVMLITHDMGVVADLATDVLVMREGEAVEVASSPELFRRPSHEYTRSLLAAVPRVDRTIPAGRVDERDGPVDDVQGGTAAPEAVAILDDVSIGYRGARLLRRPAMVISDVSLRIGAGEVCGLVGESGSGKSTIGKALVGLLPVTSGSVRIQGKDIASLPRKQLRELRSRIGYVFQDPASSLNPRNTVAENIGEPLRVHQRLGRGTQRERARELLDAVRLPREMLERFPHELSGGQRQRVAIARALVLGPDLLIADEPTSALDVSVQAAVLELIRSLQRDLGFSCLFVSHDLAVVRGLADRVAVLQNGRLMEEGPVADVFEHPESDYTRRLLAAVLTPDPVVQRERRRAWQATFSTRAVRVPEPVATGEKKGRGA